VAVYTLIANMKKLNVIDIGNPTGKALSTPLKNGAAQKPYNATLTSPPLEL
jgi:hypothetical protein